MGVSKTACFMTPLVELKYPGNIYTSTYHGTYMGDMSHTPKPEDWGKYLYFVYDGEVEEGLAEHFRKHPLFVTEYSPEEGKTTFVLKVPDEKFETVMKPFREGKYSEVDRTYVDEHFPRKFGTRLYANRLVFDKDKAMKEMWERRIGVDLPDDAEVWSKPLPKEEVYGYKSADDAVDVAAA